MNTIRILIHTEPSSTVLWMVGLLVAAALRFGRTSIHVKRFSVNI